MNSRKLLLTAATVAATLLAASCNEDNDSVLEGPMTLKQFNTIDLGSRTTDTAVPVEINDLPIDDSNEDPAQFDDLLQSS